MNCKVLLLAVCIAAVTGYGFNPLNEVVRMKFWTLLHIPMRRSMNPRPFKYHMTGLESFVWFLPNIMIALTFG